MSLRTQKKATSTDHSTRTFITSSWRINKQVSLSVQFLKMDSHFSRRENRKQLGRKCFRVESSDRAEPFYRQSWGVSWHSMGNFFKFCVDRVRVLCDVEQRVKGTGDSSLNTSSRLSIRGFLLGSGLVRGVTLFLLINVLGPLFTSSGLSLCVFTASTSREIDSTLHP